MSTRGFFLFWKDHAKRYHESTSPKILWSINFLLICDSTSLTANEKHIYNIKHHQNFWLNSFTEKGLPGNCNTYFIANVVEVLLLLLHVSSLPKIFHSICPIFSLSVCNLLKNLRHSEEIESIMSPFPLNSFELLSCNHYCRLMPSKSSSAGDKMNSFW